MACSLTFAIQRKKQGYTRKIASGRGVLQIAGAFADFERSMIRQRVRAGLDVIKAKIARDSKFETKAGR